MAIETEVSPDQIMALPMVEAMNLLGMMVWLEKLKTEPTITMAEAMMTPLSAVLEIVTAAEVD